MTEDRDDKRVQEIRERCEKATPGPWVLEGPCINSEAAEYMDEGGIWIGEVGIATASTDGEFIANARQDIDYLLSRLEAMERERDALMKILHDLTPGGSEFVSNPKNCAAWVKRQEAMDHEIIVENVAKRKEAIEACDQAIAEASELRKALELVQPARQDSYGWQQTDGHLIHCGCPWCVVNRALTTSTLAAAHLAEDERVRQERDRLREALEWYSIRRRYWTTENMNTGIVMLAEVLEDHGQRARQAIEGGKD